MALPLIPIILAVTALGSGIAQGISSAKNSKEEANALKKQAEDQISERSRQAKKLMQQQKTSFLKSGVYFDSGSPTEVINETYDTMQKDVNAIVNDSNTQIKNLNRQGKTAFYSSVIQGLGNAALAYFGMGGAGLSSSSSSGGFKNWWNALYANGKTGGFGQLPTSNGLYSNATKIV